MNDPTESARALLFRHGLPEDVIDGALALHAQELAALQRLRMDELDLTGQKARIVGRIVDLIDPSLTSATPAGPAPATDGDTLRERIAALFRHPPGVERLGDATPGEIADAVLAVLLGPIPADTGTATWTAIRAIQLMNEARAAVPPAPDQQAAVWLDAATRLWHQTTGLTEYGRGARWAIGELRVLAGEAQQAPCGRPASMATAPCSAGDHCCEGPSEAQQDPTQAGPRRGDWFEQWLVMQRDRHGWQGTNDRVIWDALDTVVGLYRMYADAAVARSGQPETDEETRRG